MFHSAFSIFANETTNISGTDQLSLDVIFSDEAIIWEIFLGSIHISPNTEEGLANTTTIYSEFEWNMEKFVDQSYDCYIIMFGKEGGV